MLDHMLTADAMLRDANMGVLDKLKIVAMVTKTKGTVEQERRSRPTRVALIAVLTVIALALLFALQRFF